MKKEDLERLASALDQVGYEIRKFKPITEEHATGVGLYEKHIVEGYFELTIEAKKS